jgi:transposase
MHDCCQGLLCCILTNLEERTLLDLLPGRQQERVTRRLMSMANRHQVEIVSMDMWKPYRRAFQTVLPQARIVVDKFHVVRMANEALEKIRKGLRKELKPNQRRTLKGDRKILLKRAHDVSDRERLIMETWTGAFPPALGGLRAQGALLPYLGLYQSAWCRTDSRHLD